MHCICGNEYFTFKGAGGTTGCDKKPHNVCLECGMILPRDARRCEKMNIHGSFSIGCSSARLVQVGSKEHKEFLRQQKKVIN